MESKHNYKPMLVFILILFILTACADLPTPTKPSVGIQLMTMTLTHPTPTSTAPVPAVPAETIAAAPTLTVATALPASACASHPVVSRFAPVDGKGAIAYSAGYSGDGLTLTFPDTGATVPIHQLNKLGLAGTDMGIAWSPDGTRLAFLYVRWVDGREEPEAFFRLADLLAGEICSLTEAPLTYTSYISLVWSPDGKWLAWAKKGQLAVLRVADGTVLTLAQDAIGYSPIWVDTTQVAYIRSTEVEFVWDLVSQPLDGSAPTVLLEKVPVLSAASLSPDGNWLAYIAHGTKVKNLYSGAEQDFGEGYYLLNWSPDGQHLLGGGDRASGLDGLFVAQPQISNQVLRLNFSGCLGNDPWAIDSRRFVVLLCMDGTDLAKMGIYNLDDMEVTELPIADPSPSLPVWNKH